MKLDQHLDLPEKMKNKNIYKQWEKIIDTQMHFNDMLMRLRTLGLSMVITIIGAGILFINSKNVGSDFTLKPLTFITLFFSINLICGYLLNRGFLHKSFIASTSKTEVRTLIFIYVLPWIVFVYFTYNICRNTIDSIVIPLGTIITGVGVMLLISLYLLDRFYYYELLVGAVNQGTKIEKHSEELYLSTNLSKQVELKEASKVVTLYYALPALGGLSILFGWLIKANY